MTTSSTREGSIKYRPDIDGLRAVAVLSVVAGHAGFLSGGFIGVDVFFVISGYLITAILVGEMQRDAYSLTRFYERRVRRLFPALFVMMAASALAACWLMLPEELNEFGASVVATALYFSNMLFWSQSGYFDSAAATKPLLHTWSLAVEEQFYIVFPLLLALVWRLGRRRQLALHAGVALTLLATFGLSVWALAHRPVAAFYWAPLRAWELMCGALPSVGLILPLRGRWLREIAAGAGLALIFASALLLTETTPFPGLAAAPACLGATVLVMLGDGERTLAHRLLSWPPLVFVGMISYSLYLWHWPILVFSRYAAIEPLGLPMTMAALALAFAAATASWWWVERPFRMSHGAGSRTRVLIGAGAVMAAAISVGLLLTLSGGAPWRVPPAVRALARQHDSADPRQLECHLVFERRAEAPCRRGAGGPPPSVLLVGDSHADAIAQAFFEVAEARGVSGLQITDAGWAPALGFTKRGEEGKSAYANAMLLRTLAADPALRTVLVVLDWRREAYEFDYFAASGELVSGERAVRAGLSALARRYPDRRFVLFGPTPVYDAFGGRPAARALFLGRSFSPTLDTASFAREAAALHDVLADLAALPNVTILDPSPYLCSSGGCPGQDAGGLLYRDADHLSLHGARRLAPLYARVVMEGR